jgi:hypothetical protein
VAGGAVVGGMPAWHPRTVAMPAVGEADVVVVDTLVGRAARTPRAARSAARAAAGERETRRQAPPAPRNPPAWAQEAVGVGTPEVGELPAVVVLRLLQPGRHLYGAGACSVGGGCGGVCRERRPRTPAYKALDGHRPRRA